MKKLRYGLQIGFKFNEDGSPKKYPGNTVIADVSPGNPAYEVIKAMGRHLAEGELGENLIFLPEDSYHMTVIRGVNDYVRQPEYWPPEIPENLPMSQVDDFFEERVKAVPVPDCITMRFHEIRIDEYDVRLCLKPLDEQEETKLRTYRDQVAERLGFRLPGHDEYTYHVTLAYVLWIPEGVLQSEMEERVGKLNEELSAMSPFSLSAPRIAFYDDMMNFYSERIPRA